MVGKKEVLIAILISVLLIAAFIFFKAVGNEGKQKDEVAYERLKAEQNILLQRRGMLLIYVSRGANVERPKQEEPKKISFSGPNVPKHDEFIDERIIASASEKGVNPYLLAAMVWKESTFNPFAVNGDGCGLLQLEWVCCKEMGVEYPCTDIDENLKAGAGYFKRQLDNFGDEKIAIAAYNYGPPRVERLVEIYGNTYEDIEPYLPGITRYHVKRVFEYRQIFEELNGQ